MAQADTMVRRQLDEKAHNSPLLRQSTRTVGGRASGHEESCTCGVQPVRRIATTTTTDSRTLYNPRDDISLTSPELGRVHSPISHKRTISSTAPTGLGIDTLQSLMLAQRSQSNATSESRYSDSVASFDRNQPSTIATGTCPRAIKCVARKIEANRCRDLGGNRRVRDICHISAHSY